MKRDVVSERFELVDELAGFAFFVDAVGVEVGAEVVVAGGGVVEEVPDDGEDGAFDCDKGFELAAAADDAAVTKHAVWVQGWRMAGNLICLIV